MNPTFPLNNGTKIPNIGLGTWNSKRDLVGNAVKYAIEKVGYTHIDCASIYGNQKQIGEVFQDAFNNSDIKRDSIYITSKLWNSDHRPENVLKACKKTLSDLKIEYLDLYLMHWALPFVQGSGSDPLDENGYIQLEPVPIQDTWEAMEELVNQGLVKSIGVSNFNTQSLLDLLSYSTIKPVVNQIELHPYNSQSEFVDFMKHSDIVPVGYSPLGSPGVLTENDPILLDDEILKDIANSYNKTPAEIVLNWNTQRGVVVIPKSTNNKRILENFNSFDFKLTTEEISRIDSLNKNHRFVNPKKFWKIPYFD